MWTYLGPPLVVLFVVGAWVPWLLTPGPPMDPDGPRRLAEWLLALCVGGVIVFSPLVVMAVLGGWRPDE